MPQTDELTVLKVAREAEEIRAEAIRALTPELIQGPDRIYKDALRHDAQGDLDMAAGRMAQAAAFFGALLRRYAPGKMTSTES
jgi:hypothetical protein